MTTHIAAAAPPIGKLPEQDVTLPAGQAREVAWLITTPANAAAIDWEVIAREKNGAAKDGLKFTQQVVAAVPITVQQATLMQVEKETQLKVARPADSLPGRGGVAITLQPKLAGSVEGLRRYFESYPFSCLEQQTSIAIGLRDTKRWQATMDAMPRYMDEDGLARYFPGDGPGSDVLTAYLLSISHEAGLNIPDNTLEKLQNGLIAFVEGRITRAFWSPKKDLDMRKLAAVEALTRYGKAQPRMLDSIQINPNLWPTSAVIDWLSILQRMPELPQRAKRMTDADQILRARLNYQGTRMGFSTENDDYWWWLMASGDLNALKLLLVVSEQPAWRDDVPRLMIGTLQRQQRGHWGTTTANAWGRLTLEKFSRLFENQPVNGVTRATLENTAPQIHSWAAQPNGGKLQLPWPAQGAGTLTVTHEGSGKPWLTLQSLAAVQLKQPFSSGYRVIKTVTPLEQQKSGVWRRGDTMRIKLDIDAQTDMTWVALNDPIPAGASILGSGLGRDSQLATAGERAEGSAELAYQERRFDSFRAFYTYVPKGKWSIEYTVRLNNAGNFQLPPTRVEAMYAPEMFGEIPNAAIAVQP